MNRCLVIVVVITLTALAVSDVSGGGGSDVICAAKEWMGGKAVMTGTIVNGTYTVTRDTLVMFAYSALKQKISLMVMFTPGRLIFDYPASAVYNISYTKTGFSRCTKSSLPGPFPEICVPAEHVVTVDPHTSFGAGSFMTYGWEAESEQGGLRRYLTMSTQMLPMFEETVGTQHGAPYFQNVFYYNTSAFPISDDTFKIPPYCP